MGQSVMANSTTAQIEGVTERVAGGVKNVTVVFGVVSAVIGAVFGAGIFYATMSNTITDYVKRFERIEQASSAQQVQISELSNVIVALKTAINTAFSNIGSGSVSVGDLVPSTEPLNNGGGNLAACPSGSFVIGLQTFKDSNGQRTVRIQCGKLTGVALP